MRSDQRQRTATRRAVASTPLLALLLAGCGILDGDPVAQDVGPARLPAATCAQVEATLRDLQTKVMINVDTPGEARIEQAGWLSIGQDARDQVVNALAVKAACAVERPPAQQPVTIRNETGEVIAERSVQVWEGPTGD